MKPKYLTKSCTEFLGNLTGTYQKPSACPHCGIGTDATITETKVFSFNDGKLLAASCRCTSCNKIFFFACERKKDNNAIVACLHPDISLMSYTNETLGLISERFMDMYNQALQAEHLGNIELAAMGYRSSLEILVKDYAISELGLPKDEVAGKNLHNAIKDYLKQEDLVNTADVIRILGNDYTHYNRKYPQHDFELLKGYMEIFLKQIEVQYMIKHPPVARTP